MHCITQFGEVIKVYSPPPLYVTSIGPRKIRCQERKPTFNTLLTCFVSSEGGFARIFSTYFDNNKLKNETRELSKNVAPGVFTF